jgi:folate-dependent phosphoribosylglycinamide formyltransferase PurN
MRYKGPYKQLSHSKIEKNLRETVSEGDMVTLHGYLRILSPDVCDLPCTILNGHPAPLHLAPDLKGKDPQDRIFEMKHPLGTVIHEVTSVVDDGEVLYYNDAVNDCDTVDDVYASQKILSFRLWLQCLQERL